MKISHVNFVRIKLGKHCYLLVLIVENVTICGTTFGTGVSLQRGSKVNVIVVYCKVCNLQYIFVCAYYKRTRLQRWFTHGTGMKFVYSSAVLLKK